MNRECVPWKDWQPIILCPDPNDSTKETICPATTAPKNADSYAFVACGVWFSSKLSAGSFVPLPPSAPPTGAKAKREEDCDPSDWLPIDAFDDDDPPPPASSTAATPSTRTAATPTTITPKPTVTCNNNSLEDGDGLCTCYISRSITFTTFTPTGGPGAACSPIAIPPP
jgi:hypothetical protein